MSKFRKTLAKNVAFLMKKGLWEKKDLCKSSGISLPTLNFLLNPQEMVRSKPETIQKVAKALGVTPEDLLNEKTSISANQQEYQKLLEKLHNVENKYYSIINAPKEELLEIQTISHNLDKLAPHHKNIRKLKKLQSHDFSNIKAKPDNKVKPAFKKNKKKFSTIRYIQEISQQEHKRTTELRPEYYRGDDGKDLFSRLENGLLPKEETIGFYKGNILKYVFRESKKGETNDLDKAMTYLKQLKEFKYIHKQ